MIKIISFILLTTMHIQAMETDIKEIGDSEEDQIRLRWDQFITYWEAGDAASCASFYTPSGMNIPNAFEPNSGREEIEQFYNFLFDNNQSSVYKHTTHDLKILGNDAVEYGEFTVDWITNEGTSWTYKARTMAHWVKNRDGIWEIEKLLFNLAPE